MENRSTLRLVEEDSGHPGDYRCLVGELWTAQQRQMHSLHYVVSYRGSCKPELPDFCIRRYSNKGQVVLDPFSGRGTTALQAALLGRISLAFDINPLAVKLTRAKISPVGLDEIVLRLNEIDFRRPVDLEGYAERFAPFYHPDTYRELLNLRAFIGKNPDNVNNFIELIALSRLHGHSPGFFSVYSFPQISIPPTNQRLINIKRGQIPGYRAVAPRLIKKAAQVLTDGFSSEFFSASGSAICGVADARRLDDVSDDSVDLIVTSPPFYDNVSNLSDCWLEFWFGGVGPDRSSSQFLNDRGVEEHKTFIGEFLTEFVRVLKPGSRAVIEVGEMSVDGTSVSLDEIIADSAASVSVDGKTLLVQEVLVNKQNYTKLANCFNADKAKKGNNTNRLVVLKCTKKRNSRKVSHRRTISVKDD